LLASGHRADGFAAACHGMAVCAPAERTRTLAELAPVWQAADVGIPLDGAAAFERGIAAAGENRLEVAVAHLRWAVAVDPGNPQRTQSLAVALGRLGYAHDAIRVLSHHERGDATRLIGRLLVDCGRDEDAVKILRYAARRFRTAEDWALLATAAHRSGDDPVAVSAGQRAAALGVKNQPLLITLATSLYRMGDFIECERVAQQLITEGDRTVKLAGLHAMARALAGQGRHVDALPYAKAATELGPEGDLAAELAETMNQIVAQDMPPVRPSVELSMERQACDELEAGKFETLMTAVSSPSWGIARIALAACEVRRDDESGIPVSPRALEAALVILERSTGATQPEAVLARIRALRIRDNAFIQIDPPPPLGARYTPEDFERAYAERERRPRRASTASAAR
jgi:tetratricopeptide (TPR) repeat protein